MAAGTKIHIDLVLNTKGFRPLGRINGQLGEFEKSLDASNARVLAFGASAGAILAVRKAFTATVKSMIEVEKSLQDINVVLNTSTTNLKKFGSDLFSVASQTGQSFRTAAEAATELARQGLGLEETLKRTKDALILARLSGMDAAEAVKSLTAALNTFNDSALDSTTIINKLANVDAAFAVSSDDLAKALGRVGASSKAAGVSFDELLAIVTTVQQKTARGGAVIGNSFKTIFTRIQRPRVIKQLEELGIRVRDLQGETLPALKVLGNLARQFDYLTAAQRAQISELVGGVFQVNILKAAMSDLSSEQSIYNKALKISAGSTDEAIQRNTRLNETLSAQFNRVVNSFKEGAAELGGLTLEPAIRNLLNVGDAIADASKSEGAVAKAGQFIGETLFKAIGKFLGGPGLLIIGFTLFKTFKQLGRFAADAFKTLTGLNQNFQTQLNLQKQIFDVLSENPDLMRQIKDGTISVEDAHEEIYRQIEKNTGALDRQLIASQALAKSLMGAGVGISPDFGATTGGKKEFPKKSSGYIPNFARDRNEILGMAQNGYSRSQLRNATTRKERLYDGRGGSQMATVNGYEGVHTGRNRGGNKATFVVPPKGTDAYKRYMSALSGGFVPNFMASTFLKKGKDFKPRGRGGSFTGAGEDKVFKHLGDKTGTTLMLKDGRVVVSDKPLHGMAAMDAGIDPRKIVGGGFHNVRKGQLSFGESDMTDVGELDKLLARGFIPNFIDPEQEKKLKELEAMLKNPANKVAKGPKKGHWKLEQKDAMLANARTLYAGIMGKAIPPSTKDPRAAIGLAREAYKSMSDPTVGVGGGGTRKSISDWKGKGKGNVVLDAKQKYGLLGLYGAKKTNKGFAWASPGSITNLGGTEGALEAREGDTRPLGLQSLAGMGAKKIGIANLQFRSLVGSLDDAKEDKQSQTKFSKDIREHFAKPTSSLARDFAKNDLKLGNQTPSNITASRKAGRLFPLGAEGEIFETVARAISAGADKSGDFEKGTKGSLQSTWDFEETGRPSSGFKKAFGFGRSLVRADAKRSLSTGALESLVNKIFSTGEMNLSEGKDFGKEIFDEKGKRKRGKNFKWQTLDEWTGKSGGYIPNFNALFEAVRRERDAGVSKSKIRAGQDGSLISGRNPFGLGVYNTDDEPLGLGQGVRRERRRGKNPKRSGSYSSGYVPNFQGQNLTGGRGMQMMGVIIGMQTLFSGLQTAMKDNTAAVHVLGEVQDVALNAYYMLQAATMVLNHTNQRLIKVNQQRLKEGKKPVRESKLTDIFTKEGRADMKKKWRGGREGSPGDPVSGRGGMEGWLRDKGRKNPGRGWDYTPGEKGRFGKFTKSKGVMGKLARGGSRLAGGAGKLMGGLGATAGAAVGAVAAGAMALYASMKAVDAAFQMFKVRDLQMASKSFQAITERNQQLANDLTKYSEQLQKFSDALGEGGGDVGAVMAGLAQLGTTLQKLSPEIREKFAGIFDPKSAQVLVNREQTRLTNENKRAENRKNLAAKTAELGDKEGLWESFKRTATGGILGAQIDEKAYDANFKSIASSIFAADEGVKGGLGGALARQTPEEQAKTLQTLSVGSPKEIAKVLGKDGGLGFSQETIDSFMTSMNRSGTAGLRLREAMAKLAIDTDKQNQLQKALNPIVKQFATEMAAQREAIRQTTRAMELEHKIRLKVGEEMSKGANLFLTGLGQIDLKRSLDLDAAGGARAKKLTQAGKATQRLFGTQTNISELDAAGGAGVRTSINQAMGLLASSDPAKQAQGTAKLKEAQEELTKVLPKLQEDTQVALTKGLQDLIGEERKSREELQDQTAEIHAVAEAQKKTFELQRKIAEVGGVKFEGAGAKFKELMTNRLMANIAGRTGSVVGAARFRAKEGDITQELQGGRLSSGQRAGFRFAANLQGQAVLGMGSQLGLQLGGARNRADTARIKANARFQSDMVRGEGGVPQEVQSTLQHSRDTFDNLTQGMQQVFQMGLEMENEKMEQMKVLTQITKELNDQLTEQANLRKTVADYKGQTGMGLINTVAQMYQATKAGSAIRQLDRMPPVTARLDLSGVEMTPQKRAQIQQEWARMHRGLAAQSQAYNRNAGYMQMRAYADSIGARGSGMFSPTAGMNSTFAPQF